MLDYSPGGGNYNRFIHLDGAEDRILYYLLSPNNKNQEELKQTHIIWKLLLDSSIDALKNPTPKYIDVIKKISNDNEFQVDKRIFRSPHFEDGFLEQATLLKIYIDSIIPQDKYTAVVNFGIDVITHNKTINLNVPDEDKGPPIDIVDGIEIKIETKSRISVLAKAILFLLNGADVAGVGRLVFSPELSRYNQAQYGLWNNRNFEGMKIVLGAYMSGVS